GGGGGAVGGARGGKAVTEAEWLACVDPEFMICFLDRRDASGRKLRLLACAFWRRVRHLLPDQRCATAVEVAERFADGRARKRELEAAEELARLAYVAAKSGKDTAAVGAALAAMHGVGYHAGSGRGRPWYAPYYAADYAADAAAPAGGHAKAAERTAQCGLLRCAFANPFRRLPALNSSWFTWNGGTVAKLARVI